jgi:hypothetical protein
MEVSTSELDGSKSRVGLIRGAAVKIEDDGRETPLGPAWLRTLHDKFARLMLIWFLKTDTVLPLTLEANVPVDGRKPTLRFRGDTPDVTVEVDPRTLLPTRLLYRILLKRLGDTGSTGEVVDSEMVTANRQQTDGLWMPRRVQWMTGSTLDGDLVLESIAVNVPLTAANIAK